MRDRKIFYIDESASNPGYFLVRTDITKIPFETTIGSLAVLPSRLMNLDYADYLRFCRDILEADIRGKNNLYPIAYFKRNELLDSFVKLLNKRAEFVLWEIKNPNYKEHELALKEFEEKENLKKREN